MLIIQTRLTLTTFYIDVPSAGRLNISIYDVNGKLVNEVINTYVEAGRIYGSWSGKNISGKNMPTGIYFMKVKTSLNFHVQVSIGKIVCICYLV